MDRCNGIKGRGVRLERDYHDPIFIHMKRIFLLISPVLFLFSCKKENTLPIVETIAKGSKWNLQIGSAPAEVYSQLQKLGVEKNFTDVAIGYRQPYLKPEALQGRLNLYRAVTLQKNSVYVERVVIEFRQDKVSSIETGGTMLDSIPEWPQDTPEETKIHNNDPVDVIYSKLLAIYRFPAYSNYQLILSDKPLEKPYDADMANYNEWSFNFSSDVRPGRRGTSYVTLHFSNGKLNKIRFEYNEADFYN